MTKTVTASPTPEPALAAEPQADINEWIANDADVRKDTRLKRAWTRFEQSQKYKTVQAKDRKIIIGDSSMSFLIWWGAEAYRGPEFLVAIVADPSRSDPNRYGLVVIAAPESAGGKYKPYWVAREEDMSRYIISPASGSVFVRCYREDGTYETKTLGWYRSRQEFRLK
ncbi:MAG TPA: hypothetical protein VJS17_03150 [Pyrinomonadaceae bacterium]|nr:hypothetical protein [Pyrinomonadaceae bacterium]